MGSAEADGAQEWRNEFRPELKAEGFGLCVIEVEPVGDAVKLTVTHSIEREGSKLIEAVSGPDGRRFSRT